MVSSATITGSTRLTPRIRRSAMIGSSKESGTDAPALNPTISTFSYQLGSISDSPSTLLDTVPVRAATSFSRTLLLEFAYPTTITRPARSAIALTAA